MTPTPSALFVHFCIFSLIAFGGANAVLPEMHRDLVETQHWLTGSEFSTLFAIAQAAPGPNVLVVTLLGWKLAGMGGALATTAGMCIPSSILSYQISGLWRRFGDSPWRKIIQRALAPITIGLVMGSSWIISRGACTDIPLWMLWGICTLISWRSKLNPLWTLALGASIGVLMGL